MGLLMIQEEIYPWYTGIIWMIPFAIGIWIAYKEHQKEK